jgi:hypothetical protein
MTKERSSQQIVDDEPLYCDACGRLMTRADLRDTECPCLCTDCCNRIDRDYEAKRDEQDLFGWFE